ncbi:MAG: T9SS type A sorting domain-containing protein [Candidatus Eisenbacteria sp.]|nr:T9SS type A sorting domain-containing protein [Candidatus Eisenbacteria bacterium]
MKPYAHTPTTLLLVTLLITVMLPVDVPADTPPELPLDRSQSTTGPIPPPGVAPKVARVFTPGERAVILSDVPGYGWRHGCGPTAVGMVIGYHDGLGMDDLIPGDASTQTSAVNQAIASQRSAPDPAHYEDYSLPIDNSGTGILPDVSEPPAGDEHGNDCIADFMFTSRSALGNYYGWSYGSHIDDAFISYVEQVNTEYSPQVVGYTMSTGQLDWDVLTGEIDAGRPMVFLVDSDANGGTDHFVTVVGYTDSPTEQYGCLDTWYPAEVVRWCEFMPMGVGQPWGVWKGWSLNPDRTLHVDPGGAADYVDIQDALDAIHSGGRVVVHPGTYAGPRNRDLDFGGKTLILESVAGSDSTIIDCEGLGRGFDFHSQETVDSVVDGFTIKDGLADVGGGIRCFWTSSPTLRNLIIDGCGATTDGGGFWAGAGSAPSISDVTIFECTADRGGGLHCSAASPALEWVTLHGNSAVSGGGVCCAGTSSPVILRTIISGSTSGEALYCDGADTPSTSHCCVHGNAGGDSLCGDYAENLFVNPRYCDPYTWELTLRDDSVCIPGNNVWGEQMGAWGEGNCPTGIPDDPQSDDTPVDRLAFRTPTPNPTWGAFELTFELPDQRPVTVQVYSASGRLVRQIESRGALGPGIHTLRWDGLDGSSRPVPSGVYFFRATVGDEILTRRAVVLR